MDVRRWRAFAFTVVVVTLTSGSHDGARCFEQTCYGPNNLFGSGSSPSAANEQCMLEASSSGPYNCNSTCSSSCPGKLFWGIDGCSNATWVDTPPPGYFESTGRCVCRASDDNEQ